MPSIVEYFERAVRRHPGKCAVRCAGIEVTYVELDRWAGRIASDLRVYEREDRIGVLLDHAPSAAAAILGVLRSGKTCVPLDYLRPVDRLELPLIDADVNVIICDERDVTRLMQIQGRAFRTVLVGDHVAAAPRSEPSQEPQDGSAFIVYTSGSTGRPKGVIRTHQSYYGLAGESSWFLKPTDRCLLMTRCHTSQGVSILCQALMSGATVCLWHRGVEPSLIDYIHSQEITVLWMTPSVFRALARTLDAAHAFPTVRVVRLDGETVRKTDFESFQQFFRDPCVFVNSLGSAETGCFARNVISADAILTDDVSPAGQPPSTVEVTIVDDAGAEVAPGDTGELVITAPWLSPGYWNRPEETQLRFRSLADGRRAFFSGDLGMRTAAGQLVHLGRNDFQVKIWGYRVELGGIEAQLRGLASVREAVVSVCEDPLGENRLVAHVTATDPAAPPTIERMREHLNREAKLPEYMVPSAFIVLDALPLTAAGKVDRKALPVPDLKPNPRADAMPRDLDRAPPSPTEAALAAIWADLLGIERPGVEDNFFHLGGHSLLVMRLVAGISRELGVELAPRAVFGHPTLAALAEQLDELVRVGASLEDESAERQLAELVGSWSELEVATQLVEWSKVALEPAPTPAGHAFSGPRRQLLERLVAQHRIDARVSQPIARRADPSCEATFAQRFMWDVNELGDPVRLSNAQAFAIHTPLDPDALGQAVAALVERQAALRTVFALDGDRLIQTVRDRGPGLDVVDLSRSTDADRMVQARELFGAIGRPHDLGRQAVRAQLVRLDEHEHLLLLAAHHIVLDGFSRGVFWSDLRALYRAAVSGTRPDLGSLEFQFADHCFWQTTLAHRPVGKRQLDFWASTVADYEHPELPGDLGAPARARGTVIETYPIGSVPFIVEGASWNALTALCSRLGVMPYTVIATALFLFVTRSSGRREACVLSSSQHRDRPGSERLIGNFVTGYPLRIGFDDNATLERAVLHCDRTVLAHREHQGVAPLSPSATWSEVARYNLNYLLAADRDIPIALGDAHVEPLSWPMHERRTTHDLALYARQGTSGVRGPLVYNAARFSPANAGKVAARLCFLIDAITTDPSQRVASLPTSYE